MPVSLSWIKDIEQLGELKLLPNKAILKTTHKIEYTLKLKSKETI